MAGIQLAWITFHVLTDEIRFLIMTIIVGRRARLEGGRESMGVKFNLDVAHVCTCTYIHTYDERLWSMYVLLQATHCERFFV